MKLKTCLWRNIENMNHVELNVTWCHCVGGYPRVLVSPTHKAEASGIRRQFMTEWQLECCASGDGEFCISCDYHYTDVIITTLAPQITSLAVVYQSVYSDADQRKHQSSASLAFVWGIHRDRWIHRTKGQLRGKCFHLTSSCSGRHLKCIP